MTSTSSLPRAARSGLRPLVLSLCGLAAASTALAGPRVGDVIGQASTNTAIVQARVLSSSPVVADVAVPRQACYDELQQVQGRSDGTGALLGAIAGGAAGNAIGKGGGRALATGLGIFGGAILGDHIQNEGRPTEVRTVRRCEQQTAYERRVVAYNVDYEYGGQRYSTQTTQAPGATIPLQVSVAPAVLNPPVAQATYQPNYPTRYDPVYAPQPAPVVVAPYVAPVRYVPGVVFRDGWWGWPREERPEQDWHHRHHHNR